MELVVRYIIIQYSIILLDKLSGRNLTMRNNEKMKNRSYDAIVIGKSISNVS